jgi:hypothetical protein
LALGNFSFAASNVVQVTKFDNQSDGIADSILLERPNLSVSAKLKGNKIISIEIQKRSNVSLSLKYRALGDKLILTYGFATNARYFFNKDACVHTSDADPFSLDALGSLAVSTETQTLPLDTSCSNQKNLEQMIQESLTETVSNKKTIAACLDKYDSLASQKWTLLPSSAPRIICEGENTRYRGLFDAKKSQIKISKTCSSSFKELNSVLKEELLHSFGIKDETLAKCLAECPEQSGVSCRKFDKKNESFDKKSNSQYTRLVILNPDGSPAGQDATSYNSAKTIEVPREIAMAQVPEPQVSDLKMTHSVETSTVSETSSYPSSLMQFAATAVLPEKAFAGTLASSESSTHSRSDSTSTSTSSSLSKSSRSSAAEAYAIAKSHSSSSGSRSPASDDSGTSSLTSAPPKGVSLENTKSDGPSVELGKSKATKSARSLAGHSVVNRSSSSSIDSNSDSFSNSPKPPSSSRAPTSASHASSSANLNQYFKTAPYQEIKERLRDPKFIQDLKRNSTTVFDAQGHRYGATQGQSIYSDKGNRFVKEK